jgi:hypothetical protein
MEAKDQNMIWMTDEMDFFTLINKKLEEQGFEVLETLSPEGLSSDRMDDTLKLIFANKSTDRFAF